MAVRFWRRARYRGPRHHAGWPNLYRGRSHAAEFLIPDPEPADRPVDGIGDDTQFFKQRGADVLEVFGRLQPGVSLSESQSRPGCHRTKPRGTVSGFEQAGNRGDGETRAGAAGGRHAAGLARPIFGGGPGSADRVRERGRTAARARVAPPHGYCAAGGVGREPERNYPADFGGVRGFVHDRRRVRDRTFPGRRARPSAAGPEEHAAPNGSLVGWTALYWHSRWRLRFSPVCSLECCLPGVCRASIRCLPCARALGE